MSHHPPMMAGAAYNAKTRNKTPNALGQPMSREQHAPALACISCSLGVLFRMHHYCLSVRDLAPVLGVGGPLAPIPAVVLPAVVALVAAGEGIHAPISSAVSTCNWSPAAAVVDDCMQSRDGNRKEDKNHVVDTQDPSVVRLSYLTKCQPTIVLKIFTTTRATQRKERRHRHRNSTSCFG